MAAATTMQLELLPGAPALLAMHARELPQRDDLCGAFCGALALRAAGIESTNGEPLDQDAVALAAGSVVASVHGSLPGGEAGRRDYRLAIPVVEDSATSGTTAAGVQRALEELAGGELRALPFAGPWDAATLDGLFSLLADGEQPASLIANLATHHLWGSRPGVSELLGYLCEGTPEGPAPDWRVGHFVCVVGRIVGPAGNLYAIADTYPSLGDGGVHLQPREHLAAALERRDMPEGGVLAVIDAEQAERIRTGASRLGLREAIWDNGTVTADLAG